MQGQAEQLSKSRNKFLAITYKHFPGALYSRRRNIKAQFTQYLALKMAIHCNLSRRKSFEERTINPRAAKRPSLRHANFALQPWQRRLRRGVGSREKE